MKMPKSVTVVTGTTLTVIGLTFAIHLLTKALYVWVGVLFIIMFIGLNLVAYAFEEDEKWT